MDGKNPMRYSGGLMGGTWMASLAGDLGHGKFDGAYLVNNFENLNPSNTYWGKLYNLYSKVDTERERFLEFEKWWGGHFLMNKEEMEWIVAEPVRRQQARRRRGRVVRRQAPRRPAQHPLADRRVRLLGRQHHAAAAGAQLDPRPLSTASTRSALNEQTIVYCLHEKIGHLGIFVSASVAKRETAELASALDLIDTLPPGLYEAVIEDTQPDMPGLEYVDGRYLIQFAPRTIDDILALDDGREDEQAFEVVKRVSRDQPGPLRHLRLAGRARRCRTRRPRGCCAQTNPARLERWLLLGPEPVDAVGQVDGRDGAREPPAGRAGQPVRRRPSATSRTQIEQALDQYRDAARRHVTSACSRRSTSRPGSRRRSASRPDSLGRRGPQSASWEQDELKRLKRKELESHIEEGTLLDAWARLLIYVRPEGNVVDERPFNMVRRMIEELKPENVPSLAALKAAVKQQAFVLALDEERAIAALPKLAPEMRHRRQGFDVARTVMKSRGELTPHQEERFRRVASILGLDAPVQELQIRMSHEKYQRLLEPRRRCSRSSPRSPIRATRARSPARSTRRSAG